MDDPESRQEAPLLVVDGDNMAHRAFHSTPQTTTGTNGLLINAIVGLLGRLVYIWERERPRGLFVAWDTLGAPTYRDKLWPAYQGGRTIGPEIRRQLELLPEICRAFGFGVAKQAGYEADDLVASATRIELARGGRVLILTNDRDAFQLVSEKVTVLSPQRSSFDLKRIGPHEVVEQLGVLPEQIPDFKALSGDSSDKIPGVRGFGPHTAARLLLEFGNLEAIIERWADPDQRELARLFKKVVTVQDDLNVELPESGEPDWVTGAEALAVIGAHSLASRVRKLGAPRLFQDA